MGMMLDMHIDGVAGLPQRGFLMPALVRTVAVIVPRVLSEHLRQMLLAEDQHVVQALAAQCLAAVLQFFCGGASGLRC
jgi:hypothetical protein